LPVYIEELEGVSDGVFYVGDMEHYYEVGDSITISSPASVEGGTK